MIRTILSIALLVGLGTTVTVNADPSPTPSNKKVQKQTARTSKAKTMKTAEIVPAPALKEGWSRVNGTWVHSDGYKLVNGQVVRVGTQTHKKPPKPPTKAEMEAATRNSNSRSPSPADAAAQKAAERERNLTPRPAPQTGTHL